MAEDNGKRKRIALGITGGIAAYKAAELARLMTKAGMDVFPIMTPWGARFLGPITMESLCGRPVLIETPSAGDGAGIAHVNLIRSVDLLVVAPLTANTMAKMAHGQADNFLTTTYLAHKGPTLACPAMNTAMLAHPATVRNLKLLKEDGVQFCMGESGSLACGEEGPGRMAEPAVIFSHVRHLLATKLGELQGRNVLVSAGPTCEDVDPVRYLTNRSSGKMGIALAGAFADAGARVQLVHGPVQAALPDFVELVPVRSAAEMAAAVLARAEQADVVVMAAAVADYRPPMQPQKLKKSNFDGVLRLERTTDILAALGARKRPGQCLVGFAAESEQVDANARQKLNAKNLDFICANDISRAGLGFASDRNRILLLSRDAEPLDLGEGSKDALAWAIVTRIAHHLAG